MKLLVFLSFLFLSITVSSQNAFTKATVYKSDGTRLDGYIKNTTFEGTQQAFDFASENGGKTARIDAASLNKVEFADGMILEKHFIAITSMSIAVLSRRVTDYEAQDYKLGGQFMVEKVLNGSFALYQFIDKFSFAHFFYKTASDTAIQKLEYKEYVDDNSNLINKREFRNQLLFLASSASCGQKVTSEINRTEYRLQHMVSVFKKLNECAGEKTDLNNRYISSGAELRFTVNGGAAATNLTVPTPNQTSYPGLTPESFSSKIGPLFGVSMEVVPQKRQKNYILSLDALYNSYTAKTDSLHPNSYQTGIGYVKFSAFSFSPSIRFRLTKSNIAPFLEAGVGYRFLSKKEDYYYVRNNISGTQTKKEIFGGKSNSLAYFGGAGVDFKRFSIHARYSVPSNKGNTYYSTIFIMGKFVLSRNAE